MSTNEFGLDDDNFAVVAAVESVFPDGLHGVPLPEARHRYSEMSARGPRGPEVHAVRDTVVAGDGWDVPVRVYSPAVEPRPVLVWFHGGAFALGDLDTADAICRELAVAADVIVVSVDYRLAPEHRFPKGLLDCSAVLREALTSPATFGGSGPTAVGGDSAGATLAAAAVLQARDGEHQPDFQLLVYPTTAMRVSSYEYASAPLVPAAMASHFWNLYVGSDADLLSPLCAPLRAQSLAGLCPAFVVVPECDSTRGDQEEYARRLSAAGVLTLSRTYPGTAHGFFTSPALIGKARRAVDDAAAALRLHLHGKALRE